MVWVLPMDPSWVGASPPGGKDHWRASDLTLTLNSSPTDHLLNGLRHQRRASSIRTEEAFRRDHLTSTLSSCCSSRWGGEPRAMGEKNSRRKTNRTNTTNYTVAYWWETLFCQEQTTLPSNNSCKLRFNKKTGWKQDHITHRYHCSGRWSKRC